MNNIPIPDKIPELDIAIKAAQEAGNAILEIYQKDYNTFTKTDDSPVTDADLKSNKIINEILSNTKYSILSEEDIDDQSRLSKDMIWIVITLPLPWIVNNPAVSDAQFNTVLGIIGVMSIPFIMLGIAWSLKPELTT